MGAFHTISSMHFIFRRIFMDLKKQIVYLSANDLDKEIKFTLHCFFLECKLINN